MNHDGYALRRLIYASRYTGAAPLEEALRDIVGKSIQNNRVVDVTGFLLAGEGAFLQWLEGPSANVRETFARIAQDPRHGDLALISDVEVTARRFRDWNMAQRQLGAQDRGILASVGLAGFEPFGLGLEAAERLLILAGSQHSR